MPFKKIADPPHRCRHREHNPPRHIVLEAGTYEYTCPACGAKQTIVVDRPHWSLQKPVVYKGRSHDKIMWDEPSLS